MRLNIQKYNLIEQIESSIIITIIMESEYVWKNVDSDKQLHYSIKHSNIQYLLLNLENEEKKHSKKKPYDTLTSQILHDFVLITGLLKIVRDDDTFKNGEEAMTFVVENDEA